MSQSDQLVSKAIEAQRSTIENGRRAFQRAMEFPLEQTVQFQRNAAQAVMNGLETGNWAQRQWIDVSQDALSNYLAVVENAVESTEVTAEEGGQRASQGAGRLGRAAMQGLQGGQRAAGTAGQAIAGGGPTTTEGLHQSPGGTVRQPPGGQSRQLSQGGGRPPSGTAQPPQYQQGQGGSYGQPPYRGGQQSSAGGAQPPGQPPQQASSPQPPQQASSPQPAHQPQRAGRGAGATVPPSHGVGSYQQEGAAEGQQVPITRYGAEEQAGEHGEEATTEPVAGTGARPPAGST